MDGSCRAHKASKCGRWAAGGGKKMERKEHAVVGDLDYHHTRRWIVYLDSPCSWLGCKKDTQGFAGVEGSRMNTRAEAIEADRGGLQMSCTCLEWCRYEAAPYDGS